MPETNISIDGGLENTAFMLRLHDPVVFPYTLASVKVDCAQEDNIGVVEEAMKGDLRLPFIFLIFIFETFPFSFFI